MVVQRRLYIPEDVTYVVQNFSFYWDETVEAWALSAIHFAKWARPNDFAEESFLFLAYFSLYTNYSVGFCPDGSSNPKASRLVRSFIMKDRYNCVHILWNSLVKIRSF